MEDKLLSSYSCYRCKQSHRKCDRLIDGCTNCKEKGKECSYHELPRKPGPKPGDRVKRRHEPYPTSTSPPAPIIIPVIEVPPVIEGFFDSMFRVSPVFPHSKFSEILAHRRAIKADMVPDSIPHNDDMALLYAMQAVFYKKIKLHALDQIYVASSKKLLSTTFDLILSSYSMAYAFYMLGVYYMLDNHAERALFYFNNARAYVDRWNRQPKRFSRLDQLEQVRIDYLDVHLRCVVCKDMLMLLKIIMYLNLTVRRYHQLYSQIHAEGFERDERLYDELDEFYPYYELIKKDIDESMHTNFPLDIKLVDIVIERFSKPVSSATNLDLFVSVKRKNLLLIAEGAKIALLQLAGDKTSPAIRAVADHIIESAETASLGLSLIHEGYCAPVLLAIKVLLDCLNECMDDREKSALLRNLKKAVGVTREVMQTSKKLEIEFTRIVNDVEVRIADEESQFVSNSEPGDISQFVEATLNEYFGAKDYAQH